MAYDAGKLSLASQNIAGPKQWVYDDSGGESLATYAGSGWFTDAGSKGADVDDPITLIDRTNHITYRGRFSAVQDTGATQGTVVLDTGAL